ncbi:fibrobacter succinogenes major paralogous domain-containing protein [Flavobacterium sp.]|uniref:fibrobacter succinogenes major paralogous domain-containing protein n=1 Tax=Flavobacterium sp. TaxID=239 RepID=UPI0028BECCE8|nr:fibrobacter succinogenes major paralogous domain-containing protein [Flavobacterium sp.]
MMTTHSLKGFLAITFLSLFIASCNNSNNTSKEEITQATNSTIKIGSQVWTTQNLDVATFRNGDAILEAKTDEEWRKAQDEKTPAWCYYKNDSENGEKYGKLYNWYAVNDPRGLAPKGYHIPNTTEWESLISNLGGNNTAGQKIKSKNGWLENGNGTNESGFFGVPGGARYDFGSFDDMGYSAIWWTATQQEICIGLNGLVWYSDNYVNSDNTNGPGAGLSVRCLKD